MYRDTLGKLLRFPSSKSGEKLTSLQEVVSRMKPEQKDIYFVAAETKEAAESSPFVERLAKKDFEVSNSSAHSEEPCFLSSCGSRHRTIVCSMPTVALQCAVLISSEVGQENIDQMHLLSLLTRFCWHLLRNCHAHQ